MNKIIMMLALALAALANSAHAAETAPSSYQSLQPFKHFADGTGHGMAKVYKDRSKADLINILRDEKLAKDEMRVTCKVLVLQVMEAHPDLKLPFEACEGAANALLSDDFTIIACRDEMFMRDNKLTVTDTEGKTFGLWHRNCLSGEKVLAFKGKPVLSMRCLNVPVPSKAVPAVPALAQQQARPIPAVTAACPKGIALFLNAWTMDAIYAASPDLGRRVDEKIKLATDRDSKNASDVKAYMADDVSGSLGDEIIRVVNVRAPLNIDIAVQLLNPVTLQEEDDLGLFRFVDGIDRISLSDAQRTKVVQMVLPAWFSSPTVSGGARRLLVLPKSWEKPNGGRWCTLQANAAFWKANKP